MFQVRRCFVGVEMPANPPWAAANLAAPGRMAVHQAFQAATPGRIPVTLVTVLPRVSPGWFGSPEKSERNAVTDRLAAETLLNELKSLHTQQPGSAVTDCVVRTGDAWEELIRVAGNRPDTLLVCGTRGLSTVRRVLFGSTGLKLLRLAPGPVWIVKPRIDDNDSTDIVAATDLGPVGADVLQSAVALSKRLNARLHIVHTVSSDAPSLRTDGEGRIYEQLAATDYRTLPFGVRVQVLSGEADQCILKAAHDTSADLVILGTSSKTGISGLLPGSTVERLLPELTCSVLALKPEGFRSMLPSDFWTIERSAQ